MAEWYIKYSCRVKTSNKKQIKIAVKEVAINC